MLSYKRQLALILTLMVTIMSLGIYAAGYNMRRNTLEPVPAIFAWERSKNGISLHAVGLDYSTEDLAFVLDRIEELSARTEDYRYKVQIFFDDVIKKAYSLPKE